MKSIDFPGATLKIGEKQQDIYNVVHAYPLEGPQGEVIACYELTDEEIETLVRTKKLYYSRWTFKEKFQPFRMSVDPIEINVTLQNDRGSKISLIAKVTCDGLKIDGYESDGNGGWNPVTENAEA